VPDVEDSTSAPTKAPEAVEEGHATLVEEAEAEALIEEREALAHAKIVDRSEAAAAAKAALADVPREPGAPKPDPILVADGVRRTFGGLVAVDVEHLEIQRGAITALIGPNGAGKTTLFNLLTGFDRSDSGQWTFQRNGDRVTLTGVPSYKVARLGMVRTFQLTKSLSRLSVIENMKLGATEQRGEKLRSSLLGFQWRAQEKAIEARGDELLSRFRLDRVRDDFAGELSGGQRKLLEMARALMVQPDMIMLDEPMAGVNPALTQSLLGHVKDLRSDGMTVMFVEHDMDVVYDISDWVVVMAEGRIIAEGPPEVIGTNQAVIDAYLGAHHDAPVTEEEEAAQLAEAEAAIQAEEAAADEGATAVEPPADQPPVAEAPTTEPPAAEPPAGEPPAAEAPDAPTAEAAEPSETGETPPPEAEAPDGQGESGEEPEGRVGS
jgi:neutral amino acid transport system ATP-binding protein